NSPFLRILLIGFLIVLLQVPIVMISELITERQTTGLEATDEITSKWGREQAVLGPLIAVPFLVHETVTSAEGKTSVVTRTQQANFLPEALRIEARIDSQVR